MGIQSYYENKPELIVGNLITTIKGQHRRIVEIEGTFIKDNMGDIWALCRDKRKGYYFA